VVGKRVELFPGESQYSECKLVLTKKKRREKWQNEGSQSSAEKKLKVTIQNTARLTGQERFEEFWWGGPQLWLGRKRWMGRGKINRLFRLAGWQRLTVLPAN